MNTHIQNVFHRKTELLVIHILRIDVTFSDSLLREPDGNAQQKRLVINSHRKSKQNRCASARGGPREASKASLVGFRLGHQWDSCPKWVLFRSHLRYSGQLSCSLFTPLSAGMIWIGKSTKIKGRSTNEQSLFRRSWSRNFLSRWVTVTYAEHSDERQRFQCC